MIHLFSGGDGDQPNQCHESKIRSKKNIFDNQTVFRFQSEEKLFKKSMLFNFHSQICNSQDFSWNRGEYVLFDIFSPLTRKNLSVVIIFKDF